MTALLADDDSATPRARRAITVRPAPRREPPFDDEAPGLRLVGPLDRALPFEQPSEPWPGRLRGHAWPAPRPSGRGELPDPSVWGRRVLIGILEVRAGRRSLQQLAPFLSQPVRAGLAKDTSRIQQPNGAALAVRSIHVCEPADGVAEIAAVVQCGARSRAVAARLEGFEGRWRCVRLQIG